METLLRQETFNGGTDITRGLLDAASYRTGGRRRGARRAIVILTDDQTESQPRRRQPSAGRSPRADAVLSALLAPNAMGNRGGRGADDTTITVAGAWPGSGRRTAGGIVLGPAA